MTDEKNAWFVFIMSQPGKSTTPRIRLWRRLKGMGAAVLRDTDNRVRFEVLLASFDLATDPAVVRLGALVHALDVGGVPVPAAAGFEAILTGARDPERTMGRSLWR